MKDFERSRIKSVFSDPHHIILEEEVKKSVILLPLIHVNNELHILFEVRSPNIAQGLEVCFPGGRMDEKDVDELATGIRETMEELRIKEEDIEILGNLGRLINDPQQSIHGFVAYISGVNSEELRPNVAEVQKIFTVPLQYFMETVPKVYEILIHMQSRFQEDNGEEVVLFPAKELQLPERYHSKWRVRKRKIYLYEYQDQKIWGITAAFLVDFIERLKKGDRFL